jgi:hypothetical protein
MLSDLVEGRLGHLTDERLVLVLREEARQLPVWVHVRDDHRVPESGPEKVRERERLDGALRAVDADDDRAASRLVVRHAHGSA